MNNAERERAHAEYCQSWKDLCGYPPEMFEHLRPQPMRTFTMYRRGDLSETHTAQQANDPDQAQFEGVVFSDGTVAVRWMTACKSTSVWASLDDLLAVHGHPEARYGSELVWGGLPSSSPAESPDLAGFVVTGGWTSPQIFTSEAFANNHCETLIAGGWPDAKVRPVFFAGRTPEEGR